MNNLGLLHLILFLQLSFFRRTLGPRDILMYVLESLFGDVF